MNTPVLGVYVGRPARLPDGRRSAIVKTRVIQPLWLGSEGLDGDQVSDTRVHGGPEQALHHYPAEHFSVWAAQFAEAAAQLVPGSIGENISSVGMTEANVCIGDTYRWGAALIQVSQPRMPCVKIDSRYALDGLTAAMMDTGFCGWYYRVLTEGLVSDQQPLYLQKRAEDAVSLAEFWHVQNAHRPSVEDLNRIQNAHGLAEKWRVKFSQRQQWLRNHSA